MKAGTIAVVLCVLAVTGCSSQQRVLSTAQAPGSPVFTFTNSHDNVWTTSLLSNPFGRNAGVDGRALSIQVYDGMKVEKGLVNIDMTGNVGVSGIVQSASGRSSLKDRAPFRDDSLALVHKLQLVTFRYSGEPVGSPPHIGFIAEDAPAVFTGAGHDAFRVNDAVAVALGGEQRLDDRLVALEREVKMLKSEVARLRVNGGMAP